MKILTRFARHYHRYFGKNNDFAPTPKERKIRPWPCAWNISVGSILDDIISKIDLFNYRYDSSPAWYVTIGSILDDRISYFDLFNYRNASFLGM